MNTNLSVLTLKEWYTLYGTIDEDIPLERKVQMLFLEIIDVVDRHLEIRDQLTYSSIDEFMDTCLLYLLEPSTPTETVSIQKEREHLTRILKNDFLLQNLQRIRRTPFWKKKNLDK